MIKDAAIVLDDSKKLIYIHINPLIPMSDQDRISPDNNIKKIGDENKEKY